MTLSPKTLISCIINHQIFSWILIWTLRLLTVVCLYALACTIAVAESYSDNRPINHTFSVVDVGFTVTQNLHQYLSLHESVHHYSAYLNTLGINILLAYTVVGIGYWHGRPGLVVIQAGMFLFRLACGWLTQLPYSNEYLASDLDFPDCLTNRLPNSASQFNQRQHASFFFFFSGHVALASLVTAYFRQTSRRHLSYACNIFNVLQMTRLLATRGHYTIDLIGGLVIGTYAYSFMEPIDKYFAANTFVRYIVRRENMKVE